MAQHPQGRLGLSGLHPAGEGEEEAEEEMKLPCPSCSMAFADAELLALHKAARHGKERLMKKRKPRTWNSEKVSLTDFPDFRLKLRPAR